jgi:hypothetical protein
MSQWNTLENIRQQHLEKFRSDPQRFMKLSLYYPAASPSFVPFADLTFVANSKYPNMLQEIHIAEQSYRSSVDALAIKNGRLEEFYRDPKVSHRDFDPATGRSVVVADVKDIFFLQKVTDAVYEQFDKALPRLKTAVLRLEKFIKLTFPKLRALQMVEENPNNPEREQKRVKLRRYEDARRQHLGSAITLFLGVSAAGAGYGITYLANHGSAYVSPTSKYMFFGTLAFALAVLWCLGGHLHAFGRFPTNGQEASPRARRRGYNRTWQTPRTNSIHG